MKTIAFAPAHRSDILRPGPVDQDLVISVLEKHPDADMGVGKHLFRQPRRLKHAHHLTVKVNCPGKVVGYGSFFDDTHRKAPLAQKIGEGQPDRTSADDGDITGCRVRRTHNSSVFVPSIRTPSPLR